MRWGAAVVVLVLLGGCSGPVRSVTGGSVSAPVVAFPSQVVGLIVKQEDVTPSLDEVERPYVDSVAVFSLRDGDLLRATLQVSRFNRLARPGSASFRNSIVGLVGGSRPLELRVDDNTVYSTTGNKQHVFVWFLGNGLFVLSVHQDYEFPRTLLRRVLSVEVDL